MSYLASVIIERDENGFNAYSPELEGCLAHGDALDEVMANMKEAVTLYLSTLTEEEKKQLGYA